jgi:hypothetical protein
MQLVNQTLERPWTGLHRLRTVCSRWMALPRPSPRPTSFVIIYHRIQCGCAILRSRVFTSKAALTVDGRCRWFSQGARNSRVMTEEDVMLRGTSAGFGLRIVSRAPYASICTITYHHDESSWIILTHDPDSCSEGVGGWKWIKWTVITKWSTEGTKHAARVPFLRPHRYR